MLNKEIEIVKIWENIRKHPTASVEIGEMHNLYASFDKTGYETDNFQKEDHLFLTPFIVFDRGQLIKVISVLEENSNLNCEEKWYSSRANIDVYRDMKVAISPSLRLTAEDIKANPFILELLIGEIDERYYVHNQILVDNEYKEIVRREHRKKTYNNEHSWGVIEEKASLEQASTSAFQIAKRLTELSDHAIKRFMPNRDFVGKLNFSFKEPFLMVGEEPFYEATSVSNSTLRVRDLERKLNDGIEYNQKAKDEINKAIENHKNIILKQEGEFFPMFRILK